MVHLYQCKIVQRMFYFYFLDYIRNKDKDILRMVMVEISQSIHNFVQCILRETLFENINIRNKGCLSLYKLSQYNLRDNLTMNTCILRTVYLWLYIFVWCNFLEKENMGIDNRDKVYFLPNIFVQRILREIPF